MLSKKYYQELLSDNPIKRDYNKTEEDLFNYIVESEINGNYSQVREFIKRMSQRQHDRFLIYISNNKELFGDTGLKSVFLKGGQ